MFPEHLFYNSKQTTNEKKIQRNNPCNKTIVLNARNDFKMVVMITCKFFKNLMKRNRIVVIQCFSSHTVS